MRRIDRRDGIGQRGPRRLRHHRVLRERDQRDGEEATDFLRAAAEPAHPTPNRVLRPAQPDSDPAVPHPRGRYLQPDADHFGRVHAARPEHFRQEHVCGPAARAAGPSRSKTLRFP